MANNFDVEITADNTEQAKQELHDRVRKALTAMGIQAATLAKRELQSSPTRIDTGLLRNSITHALDGEGTAITSYSGDKPSKYTGKSAESGSYSGSVPAEPQGRQAVYIGTGVRYGVYVHEGTDRMAPNRFLKNGIENNLGELRAIEQQMLSDN